MKRKEAPDLIKESLDRLVNQIDWDKLPDAPEPDTAESKFLKIAMTCYKNNYDVLRYINEYHRRLDEHYFK